MLTLTGSTEWSYLSTLRRQIHSSFTTLSRYSPVNGECDSIIDLKRAVPRML